jgi:hypothetical protein
MLVPAMNLTHLYASSLMTATFVDSYGAIGGTKAGTAFAVAGVNGEDFYFVTNRHVADYNYGLDDPAARVPGAKLKSIRISGHFQPDDLSAARSAATRGGITPIRSSDMGDDATYFRTLGDTP